MTCPHAETTAILALFDEAPPGFAAHLRGCGDCQQTVAAHREPLDLITPHLAAMPAPAPSKRLWPAALLSTLAAAAAAALLLITAPPAPTTPAAEQALAAAGDERMDEALLSLELELALMHLEDN